MRNRILFSFLAWVAVIVSVQGKQKDFVLQSGQPVAIACSGSEAPVVRTSLDLLSRDLQTVLSATAHVDTNTGNIIVGTIGQSKLIEQAGIDISALKNKKQAFMLAVSEDGKLVVAGSDSHGTAYGILEISRLLGVSPWEWWADVTPEKKETFRLSGKFRELQSPSVEYRGIFINDEDWGLMPWSNKTYEPSDVKGEIGPRTNERIFELLLRLRANTYWPAMHECTLPFFLTKGNREAAKKYGIFMGASHCEPMACNAAGEWKIRGKGAYDYVNNSPAVYQFWENRVKEVAGQEILYTLGMRGVHDGKMQGAKTVEEQKAVLNRVFVDQRGLLEKYVNKDVTQVPQVFIPYKEVLDIYHAVDSLPGIKKSFIGSGVRYDLLLHQSKDPKTNKSTQEYTRELIARHVSGRLKVAPEHTSERVLDIMRKPPFSQFGEFKKIFDRINREEGLRQQLIPYFISSHPGCKEEDMAELAVITKRLDFHLEQVQDFTPTPMTVATEAWYTGFHPYTLEPVFSAKTQREKLAQRQFFFWYKPEERRNIINELRRIGRKDLIDKLYGK